MSDTAKRIEAAMEKYAPGGYDPASDDLTIPFAIELAEKDAEIAKLRYLLKTCFEVVNIFDLRPSVEDEIRGILRDEQEPPREKPKPYSKNCLASDVVGATCQSPNCDC